MKSKWFEIWADDGLKVPYILLVMPDSDRDGIAVIDPKEGDKVVFRSDDYETIRLWLLEDEYSFVDGRIISE